MMKHGNLPSRDTCKVEWRRGNAYTVSVHVELQAEAIFFFLWGVVAVAFVALVVLFA